MVRYWLIAGFETNMVIGIRLKRWGLREIPEEIRREFLDNASYGDLIALQALEDPPSKKVIGIVGFAKLKEVFYQEKIPLKNGYYEEWPMPKDWSFPWRIRFESVCALSEDRWRDYAIEFLVEKEKYKWGIGILERGQFYDLLRRAEEKWGIIIRL